MTPHEFIQKQVEKALIADGHTEAAAYHASQDALEFYKRTAQFKKPPIDECLRHARKKAKEIDGKGKPSRR